MPEVTTPQRRKSAFDFIKGAFIQEAPEATPTASAPVAAVAPTQAPAQAAAPVVQNNGAFSKARKALQESLEANALDTYDYLKFKNATKELQGDIPDEKLRFKTVFATAKVLGITPTKLVETANHYLTVLDQELKNFNEAVDEQNEAKIVAAEAKVKSLDGTVEAKEAQIKALQDEIATITAERSALATKIGEDRATLEASKTGFVTAQASMVEEIKDDIKKLTTFLG